MPNWKEDYYQYFHNAWKAEKGNKKAVAWQLTHFIEARFAELIEEIPTDAYVNVGPVEGSDGRLLIAKELKQQLKAKWLGKETNA